MTTTKSRTFLELSAPWYLAFLHLANSPEWEEGNHAAAPNGYQAYRHIGCGETVHVPGNDQAGGYEMVRAVMDICMTELLGDPNATLADRRALIHHLAGIVRVPRVSQWTMPQALGYIRSLSEEPELEDAGYDDHDGSLPTLRNR
ncbi:hypothetical protein ACGF0J_14305 [Nonomuraea sp. NPDC047897]|uniref:hypothetical protein n=1 Tax=Nonomuraea sp. NPDC047897 TaxID=3364346 RepID=UPI003724BD67